MGELSEYALAAITLAQRKVEVVGQNLANAATPGYKKRIAFSTLVQAGPNDRQIPQLNIAVDNKAAKIASTGNPADLALASEGAFAFRKDGETVYSRRAQLTIDGDGRLVDQNGFALQLASGTDLVVQSTGFSVAVDGTVVDKGLVLGRIAVFATTSETTHGLSLTGKASVDLVASPSIQQGALEASNVVSGDEMVVLVEAMRRAEAGQRIMNVYDDLLGRAITSFGETAR